MNSLITYGIIFIVLLACELLYFRIADRFNIIDKPNERSSHSSIVLRGGGIIFVIGTIVWAIAQMISDPSTGSGQVPGLMINDCYPWFLVGLVLVAGVSFIDDIRSLPDSVRLVAQFVAMAMMFYQLDILHIEMWWIVILALIVCVGASNVINFMDGINGITGGYSLSVLVPLMLINDKRLMINDGFCLNALRLSSGQAPCHELTTNGVFFDQSLVMVVILSVVVFCLFNYRPKGKAKCFAGDVGSIGIAFIMLFLIGKVIIATGDLTYLIFLLVYGVDGVLTICHRIMLHENLGEAHRKHAYQLMANELKMSHVTVSLIYMGLQLVVSLGFIYLCPQTVLAHWCYLLAALLVLAVAYVVFKKKYYHLHEEYLRSIGR